MRRGVDADSDIAHSGSMGDELFTVRVTRRGLLRFAGATAAVAAVGPIQDETRPTPKSKRIQELGRHEDVYSKAIRPVIVVPSDMTPTDNMRRQVDVVIDQGQQMLESSHGMRFRVAPERPVVQLPITEEECIAKGPKLGDYIRDAVYVHDSLPADGRSRFSAFWMGEDNADCFRGGCPPNDGGWDGVARWQYDANMKGDDKVSWGVGTIRLGESRVTRYGSDPSFFGPTMVSGSGGQLWLHETIHTLDFGHVDDENDIMNPGWTGRSQTVDIDNIHGYIDWIRYYMRHFVAPTAEADRAMQALLDKDQNLLGGYRGTVPMKWARPAVADGGGQQIEFDNGSVFWHPKYAHDDGAVVVAGSLHKVWKETADAGLPVGPASYHNGRDGVEITQEFAGPNNSGRMMLTCAIDPARDVVPAQTVEGATNSRSSGYGR